MICLFFDELVSLCCMYCLVCMYAGLYVCICMYVYMYVCLVVCMYVCMIVCLYLCAYGLVVCVVCIIDQYCVCVYVYMFTCMYVLWVTLADCM